MASIDLRVFSVIYGWPCALWRASRASFVNLRTVRAFALRPMPVKPVLVHRAALNGALVAGRGRESRTLWIVSRIGRAKAVKRRSSKAMSSSKRSIFSASSTHSAVEVPGTLACA